MTFREWYYSFKPSERDALARRLQASRGYLDMIAGGFRKPGESLCLRLEAESAGKLTVEGLRPDVPWHVIRGSRPARTSAAEARA